MEIFFVRHGQTAFNAKHVHQLPESPLNEKGRQQAHTVGQYLVSQSIDTLFASPLVRARETAEIIESHVNVPIMPLPSVAEFRRPDSLYGKKHASLASFRYLKDFFWQRDNNDWQHEGAENMFDIRNRIHDAKDAIGESKGDRVVVVSHAIFMNLFVELICNEIDLSFYQYAKGILNTLRTKNTEVFHLHFNENAASHTCAWELIEKIDVSKR